MPALDDLLKPLFDDGALTRAVLSKPRNRDTPSKVTVEPVDLRGGLAYRFTTQLPDRTHHENLQPPAARERLGVLLADYGQGLLQSEEADWQVLGEKILRRAPTRPVATRAHDRRKRYLLEEGTPVPFLVELGVMTPDGRVRKSRYDKFRQVNRFLELVDDVVPGLPADGTLRIVDFGCGKSYLTFALHHLLTAVRGREVELVGLDLKEDVIATCSALAERLGSPGLRFERGEIAGFDAAGPVDLVVSLHACDTATDEALAQAVRWEAARDPRRPVLPEGGVSARSRATCCSRSCATVWRRSALPPSSRTHCARSCSSSPATGPSWWSSSIWSTRRRTS